MHRPQTSLDSRPKKRSQEIDMTDSTIRRKVRLDAARIRYELALRAWTSKDLAAAAHVSRPTISAAINGHAISPRTAGAIASAILLAAVVVPEELLAAS